MSHRNEPLNIHNASLEGHKTGGSPSGSSYRGSTATDISVTVLTTLKEVSEAAGGLAHVGIAAAIALEIVTSAQGAKDNKESFRRLALDAASLVINIAEVCKDLTSGGGEISPLLKRHLDMLNETLEQIRSYAQKRADKAYWKRYISSRSDLERIKEFRERLNQSVGLFGVQSHIAVRESIARMSTRQESIHEELKGNSIPQRASPEPSSPTERPFPSPPSTKSNNPFRSRPAYFQAPTPSPAQTGFEDPFRGLLASSHVTGSITFNNIAGNSQIVTNNNSNVRKHSNNVYHTSTVNSNNTFVQRRGTRY